MGVASLALCAMLSLFIGVIDLHPLQVLSDPDALWLLLASRLPRTLAILLTGVSLAITGQVMQILVQNRFVEPATAGSGQSAVLGIVLVALFLPDATIPVKMMVGAITALFGTLLFLLMVQRLPHQESYLTPLVGIVYGGVVAAIATWLAYQADLLQLLDVWMTGEFSGIIRGRTELLWIAGVLAAAAYFFADQFTIASLGKDHAQNLGLSYKKTVMLGLFIISIVTAVTVVTVGVIPFVGLFVPNIVSRWQGDNLRISLPLVAYLGAMLTLVSDIVGRLLIAPYEIPVGTVFGVVGTVITLWLLYSAPGSRRFLMPENRSARSHRVTVMLSLSLSVAIMLCLLYLFEGANGNTRFITLFRVPTLISLILVAAATGVSTLLFQTLSSNRILTPSLMGFDALYVLIQTSLVFFIGVADTVTLPKEIKFSAELIIMTTLAVLLFSTLLKRGQSDFNRLILTGIIFGVLFRSLSSFMARVMSPNDYSVVVSASYARFNNVDTSILPWAGLVIIAVLFRIWMLSRTLDVMALGRDISIGLGVNHDKSSFELLALISTLVATSTALVGPVVFLGLIITSAVYRLSPISNHRALIPMTLITGILIVVGGQLLLERVFHMQITISIIIELVGGLLFLALLLKKHT